MKAKKRSPRRKPTVGPQVLNINHRTDKYPDSDVVYVVVYVGRPSPWGNPFTFDPTSPRSRKECVKQYDEWVHSKPVLLKRIKKELKGKHLLCYCAPLRCHGDILLKIANEE